MVMFSFRSVALLAVVLFVGAVSAGCGMGWGGVDTSYHPDINPANFGTVVDNPYMPLVPGTVYTYSEKAEGKVFKNVTTVTKETKVVMGVTCIVVHDTVSLGDQLKEDTFDWYAQDKQGNVWYLGEDTTEYLANGKTSKAGSWEGGVNGAYPGIMMPAKAEPGPEYRQEYKAGEAEDMGQIVAVSETVKVPYGELKECLKTKDWSMLEAGCEYKWYAKGVGVVREETSDGEIAELLEVTKP